MTDWKKAAVVAFLIVSFVFILFATIHWWALLVLFFILLVAGITGIIVGISKAYEEEKSRRH